MPCRLLDGHLAFLTHLQSEGTRVRTATHLPTVMHNDPETSGVMWAKLNFLTPSPKPYCKPFRPYVGLRLMAAVLLRARQEEIAAKALLNLRPRFQS